MKEIVFEEIDSTNAYCKRNIDILEPFTTVQSYYQSHGKGRSDHLWESKPGENLLMSIVIKDFNDLQKIHQLTQVVAYAVIKVLQEYKIEALIKWPNDIYVQGDKICGILIETSIESELQGIVIGIGLNVNDEQHQSMYKILQEKQDVMVVKKQLFRCFQEKYQEYQNQKYTLMLDELNQLSYLKDTWINYQEYGQVQFQEVLENGKIRMLDINNKYHEIYINEVSFHKE